METINSRYAAIEQLRINTLIDLRELSYKLAEVQSNLAEVQNDIEILLNSGGLQCKL